MSLLAFSFAFAYLSACGGSTTDASFDMPAGEVDNPVENDGGKTGKKGKGKGKGKKGG